MDIRELTVQMDGNKSIDLNYYPTQLELTIEDFAKRNGSILKLATQNKIYTEFHYLRKLLNPINGIYLTYDRSLWDTTYPLEEVESFVPPIIGSFTELVNEATLNFFMRNLHDPSVYTEGIRITDVEECNAERKIDIHLQFNKNKVIMLDLDGCADFTPEEFKLFARHFTKRKVMSRVKLEEKIEKIKPQDILNTLLYSIESYE